MASSRADEVAELLWELKRAGKLATYTHIARRAGFSAGANGRAMDSCLRVVRRDWPHLQWYRAIRDDGVLEKDGEQMKKLVEAGYEVQAHDNGKGGCVVCALETHLVNWTVSSVPEPEPEAVPAA
jgi:alkylated DNA nucleotide flippase Atl1